MFAYAGKEFALEPESGEERESDGGGRTADMEEGVGLMGFWNKSLSVEQALTQLHLGCSASFVLLAY